VAIDLVELLHCHSVLDRGLGHLRLDRVQRVPRWLGSTDVEFVDSVERPSGAPLRVFRSDGGLHVLAPLPDGAGYYIGALPPGPRRHPALSRRCPRQLDHRFTA